jgi:hypothetical protein
MPLAVGSKMNARDEASDERETYQLVTEVLLEF